MWRHIGAAAAAAAFLATAAAGAYAQDNATQYPGTISNRAKAAPGKSPTKGLGSDTGGTGRGGYGTLGAGDAKGGDWTGTNPGVNRGPAGAYGPAYSGAKVAPGGNGALGAGDAAVGSWTGTNPGVDRRFPPSPYSGTGYR